MQELWIHSRECNFFSKTKKKMLFFLIFRVDVVDEGELLSLSDGTLLDGVVVVVVSALADPELLPDPDREEGGLPVARLQPQDLGQVGQGLLVLLALPDAGRRKESTTTHVNTHLRVFSYYPTSNGGMQNGSSVGICTRCVHVFARLAPICVLSRCLFNKISASELSRKVIKSALLVG